MINRNQKSALFVKIKLSFFNVAYNVTTKNVQSLPFTIMLSVIQFVQILSFSFQTTTKSAWHNEKIFMGIQSVLEIFTSMAFIKSPADYLTLMYFGTGLVLAAVFLGFFLSHFQTVQINHTLNTMLCIIIKFLMTIGYVEILRLQSELLTCQHTRGPVYKLFNDSNFWTGSYIIHATVAGITIFFLICIAFIGSKLLVELKYNPRNTISLRFSKPYQNYFIYVNLALGMYELIAEQIMLVLAIQMFAGFWLFFNIHYERPFHYRITQKIWSVISGVIFYTNFMLWVSYCFETIVVKNTMIGWLITVPLLAVILMKDQSKAIDIFKINLNLDSSGTEIIEKCNFLLDLAENSEKDLKKEILLSGFFEIHKQFCQNNNCAIKINGNLSKKFPGNPKYTDKKLIVIDLINAFYQEGLSRLNTNVNLRIHFAQFLYDYMESSYKALSELDFAKELNPSFEQELTIFRLRKTIEDQVNKQSSSNGLQRALANNKNLAFKYRELQQLIETCSLLHLQFWNQLLEEVPNLQFLNQNGRKILQSQEKIKKLCSQMEQIGKLGSKSQRIVMKFFQNVCHEDYNFNKIQKNEDFDYYKFMQDQEDLSIYSFPVLVLEIYSDIKQSTTIKNVNLGTLALLGYSKADLIGRPLSLIMPEIFLQIHHTVVETFFCQKLQDQVVHNAKERQIFLKSKSNYVIPIKTTNFLFTSEKGYYKFCRMRFDFNHHNSGYVLFDLNGYVENISSACLQLLHINEKIISLQQLLIHQLFPTLLNNRQQYLDQKNPLEFYYQPRSLNRSQDFDDRPYTAPIQVLAQLYELNNLHFQGLSAQNKGRIVGYVLKIEPFPEKYQSKSIQKINKNQFQFRYSFEDKLYKMEAVSATASQNESYKLQSSSFEDAQLVTFMSLKNKKQFSMTTMSTKKPNSLGYDIKIMRLVQGQLIELQTDLDEDDESDTIKELTKKQLDEDEHEEQILSTKINNKQHLQEFIQSSKIPNSLKRAIIYSNLFMIGLFCIVVMMYDLVGNTEYQFKNALVLLSLNNQRYGSILKIQSNLQDLRNCNLNFEPYIQKMRQGQYVPINIKEMQQELILLVSSHNLLSQSLIEIDQQYWNIVDIFQESNIEVFSKNGEAQYFSYSELMQQMISKAIQLNNSTPDAFASDNDDFFFYLYNSFNSIPKYFQISQNYYYANILSLINKQNYLQNTFYFLSIGVLFVIFLSFQYYIYLHSICIQEALSQFLDINEVQIKDLQGKVSQFIQWMQFDEDDDLNEGEKVQNQELDADFLIRKKRKSSKYKIYNIWKTQINFTMFLLLMIVYSSYIYFSSDFIIDQTVSLIPLVNLTSYFPTYYRIIDNSLKEMFFNSSLTISYQPSSVDLIEQFIEIGYNLHADLHIMNQENEQILQSAYKNSFYQIYLQNACTIIILIDSTIDQKGCESFNREVLKNGLSIAITKFLENSRYLLQQYSSYDPQIQYNNMDFNISLDPKINFTQNIVNTITEQTNRKLQKVYIRACHIHLVDKLQDYLSNHYEKLQIQLTGLFLTFCIVSFIFYFLIWIPWLKSQHYEIYRSRELLQIIPIPYFDNIISLQQYIKKINTPG